MASDAKSSILCELLEITSKSVFKDTGSPRKLVAARSIGQPGQDDAVSLSCTESHLMTLI